MKINKQKLQIAMANACLSFDDLSGKSNVSRTSLRRYCQGVTEPRTNTLGKIAKALDVPVESLVDIGEG